MSVFAHEDMIKYRNYKRENGSILVKGRGTGLVLKVGFEKCTQHHGISSGVRLSRSRFRFRFHPLSHPFPPKKSHSALILLISLVRYGTQIYCSLFGVRSLFSLICLVSFLTNPRRTSTMDEF